MSLNEIIPPAFTLTLCESIGFETKSSFEEGIIPMNEFNKDSEQGNKVHAYIYSYSLRNNFVYFVKIYR